MSVRASTRVSISWSGAEPYEDTDTLVLTTDGYSLDLRVALDGPDKGEIDWSTVALVTEVEGSTKDKPRLRWDHIIDSRGSSDTADEGTFETLPNGDVSETGEMLNPFTKRVEPYCEIWRRLKLDKGTRYLVLESTRDPREGKAFIGRIGPYALGLAQDRDGTFHAWRETLVRDTWKRIYSFGEPFDNLIPNLAATIPSDWSTGAVVQLGGSEWTVRALGNLE